MNGIVAWCDWEACDDCEHVDDQSLNGCKLDFVSVHYEVADMIVCDNYAMTAPDTTLPERED